MELPGLASCLHGLATVAAFDYVLWRGRSWNRSSAVCEPYHPGYQPVPERRRCELAHCSYLDCESILRALVT